MDTQHKNNIDNEENKDYMDEDAKNKAIEKVKQKATIVNIEEIAEAEARKAADAYMTESKERQKGIKGWCIKMWKHTFFDEYYRQREINRAREEIKNTGNIYSKRLGKDDKVAHENAMKGISDRFVSEYEGTLSDGEQKKILDEKDPETVKAKNDIKKLINDYASNSINEDVFKSEKNKIVNSLKNEDLLKGANNYADNLFEIAQNARLAIEHGAKLEELDYDLDIIVGKAKSSLKTEAHFNWVDKGIDKMKKSKIGRFISPAVLSTAVGIAYSISVGMGKKVLSSKAVAYGTFGAAVAVSSLFAAANESRDIEKDRGGHNIIKAEGGMEIEPGSKRREQLEKYEYQMESSNDLAKNLRDLMFEKDKDGKDVVKDIKKEDLDKIFASLSDIEARNSLNSKNRIDLISYSNIGNVEKERTDLTILAARAKVELRKKIEGDFKDADHLKGKTFDDYLAEQTRVVEDSLLGGEKGITAQDKAFRKYKAKRVGKKVLQTVIAGLVIGGTIQEGIAFFKDDVQGLAEGIFHHDGGAITQTPLENAYHYITGNPSHMGMGNAVDHIVGGHNFKLPDGISMIQNSDGTFDVLRGDQVISDNIPLTFDANGNLDPDSLTRLGEDGIIANTIHNIVDGTKEVTGTGEDYINNHHGSTTDIHRDGWYDNDTPKPIFDQNELKLWYGGEGNTGIDANGNYVFDIKHMTPEGSFHEDFSLDAQEKMKDGALKMIFSLTQGTQNHVFEVPIDIHGNAVIDPNSEIGKLFFGTENGHAVFKGRFAEVVESFGTKDGVEHIKSLATLEGPGNDSIVDVIPTHIDTPITSLSPSLDVEPPMFIPFVARSPLEKLKQKEGFIYDESYLDRDSVYEDPTYIDEPLKITYEDENYLDKGKYLDQIVVEKKEEGLSKENIEKNITEMKNYIDKKVDIKMMEELNNQIKEPMDNNTKMSVVLPCYHEGENIYKTLLDWTVKQKDLKPEELEIITFVNAPEKDQKLDEKTISEILRFKNEHPEYKIQLVQHNFDFKTNRKMGAIYKTPTDLAVYRNVQRLENNASNEIVSSHLLRSGGADALGRNPRFLREIIDFMENHPETEQLRTQSAYPPEVREKFPLFNLITVFNHSLSQLYTRGNSNIGLGTYRARAYAEASGFDPSREYREEIDLGTRIRAKLGRKNKNAITKLVKKNAIDNPRRELFALANGDTVLRAYNNFSKPEKDKELRKFDWNEKLPEAYKKNIEINSKNMTREFDAYFQHYLLKIERESGTIPQILSGELNEKSIKSSNLHPETRALLNDPEGLALIKDIEEKRKNGKEFTRSSEEVKKLSEFATRRLFNRILLLTFGFKNGFDYDYERSTDGKLHIIFKEKSVEKTKEMAENKWKNFNGYWEEGDSSKTNQTKIQNSKEITKNKEKVSLELVKEIIIKKLGNKAKIEKLELNQKNGKLEINTDLNAGIIGGKIKIKGSLENSDDNIVIGKDLNIEAREWVKNNIENSLSKLIPEIKKYFEDEYKQEIKSMKIEDGGLTLNFKE